MSASIIIAKLLGPIAVILGAALLINRHNMRAMAEEVINSPTLIFMAGLLALIPGVAIVAFHNIWSGWPMIITIFGWICIFAGILRTCLGTRLAPLAETMINKQWPIFIGSLIYLLFGAVLTFEGYFA